MWNVIRPVALLLVLTTGCDVLNVSRPGADQGLPELHGKDIAAADVGGSLNWSPDGRELGFITNSYRTAQTYRVENGDFRLLFTLDGGQLHEVGLSADGAESFTTSSGGTPGRVIRRHSTQGTITLTNRGTGGVFDSAAEGHAVLPSPTQPVAAFTALPDSLFRIVRGSAPRLLGTGCLGIIAWSPDESQLLCMSVRDRGGYAVFRVDGGASTPLALPPNVTGYARFILWGAAGIQIVFSDIFAARIYDVSTTRSRTIIPAGSLTESVRMNQCPGLRTARSWRTAPRIARRRRDSSAAPARNGSCTCRTCRPAWRRASPYMRTSLCLEDWARLRSRRTHRDWRT